MPKSKKTKRKMTETEKMQEALGNFIRFLKANKFVESLPTRVPNIQDQEKLRQEAREAVDTLLDKYREALSLNNIQYTYKYAKHVGSLLHIASHYSYFCCEVLLERMNANFTNEQNETALHCLADKTIHSLEIIELFKSKGADLHIKNKDNKTAFSLTGEKHLKPILLALCPDTLSQSDIELIATLSNYHLQALYSEKKKNFLDSIKAQKDLLYQLMTTNKNESLVTFFSHTNLVEWQLFSKEALQIAKQIIRKAGILAKIKNAVDIIGKRYAKPIPEQDEKTIFNFLLTTINALLSMKENDFSSNEEWLIAAWHLVIQYLLFSFNKKTNALPTESAFAFLSKAANHLKNTQQSLLKKSIDKLFPNHHTSSMLVHTVNDAMNSDAIKNKLQITYLLSRLIQNTNLRNIILTDLFQYLPDYLCDILYFPNQYSIQLTSSDNFNGIPIEKLNDAIQFQEMAFKYYSDLQPKGSKEAETNWNELRNTQFEKLFNLLRDIAQEQGPIQSLNFYYVKFNLDNIKKDFIYLINLYLQQHGINKDELELRFKNQLTQLDIKYSWINLILSFNALWEYKEILMSEEKLSTFHMQPPFRLLNFINQQSSKFTEQTAQGPKIEPLFQKKQEELLTNQTPQALIEAFDKKKSLDVIEEPPVPQEDNSNEKKSIKPAKSQKQTKDSLEKIGINPYFLHADSKKDIELMQPMSALSITGIDEQQKDNVVIPIILRKKRDKKPLEPLTNQPWFSPKKKIFSSLLQGKKIEEDMQISDGKKEIEDPAPFVSKQKKTTRKKLVPKKKLSSTSEQNDNVTSQYNLREKTAIKKPDRYTGKELEKEKNVSKKRKHKRATSSIIENSLFSSETLNAEKDTPLESINLPEEPDNSLLDIQSKFADNWLHSDTETESEINSATDSELETASEEELKMPEIKLQDKKNKCSKPQKLPAFASMFGSRKRKIPGDEPYYPKQRRKNDA